ncbi:MAG: exonuclease SbcCD subunit D [SAR202 cluster bacterium]|nr:exonuclease SbcCD subunit D [SAR202 cluster bacterium]
MRILHFSDLHIGVENYGRLDPSTGLSSRLQDFLSALDEIVNFALSSGVHLVLLAGDAYKSRDPSQTQQKELAARLAKLSAAGIPVFLLVGNHDLPHSVGRANAVEIFPTLKVPNVHVGDTLTTYRLTTAQGPLQIVALPWPRRSRLLSHDDTAGLTIDQVNQLIQDRFTQGIRQQADKLDPRLPAILAAHVTVQGAAIGSERAMMLGQDHWLMPGALHLPCFDYIALGHIHKHQVLRQNPTMAYSGSLQRVDFGEESQPKGFCLIDLDPSRPQGQRMTSFEFKQVNARQFLTIEIDIPKASDDPTTHVLHAISRYHVAGAIVRLRVNLTADQNLHLRDAPLRDALKDAHIIAAIYRNVEEERRTRIAPDVAEGLPPLKALALYLDSKNTDPARKEKLLTYARRLLEEDQASSGAPSSPGSGG